MFEKIFFAAMSTIYWLAVGLGIMWLAWMFFSNMPFLLALLVFPFVFVFAVMAGAPLAGAAAFIGAFLVASVVSVVRLITALLRSDA